MPETVIPPVPDPYDVPDGATCQEASPMSGLRYFACGKLAIAVIDNGDTRPYYMCLGCTMHNLRNRGASIIFSTDGVVRKMMHSGAVKVKQIPRPSHVERSVAGTESIVAKDVTGED